MADDVAAAVVAAAVVVCPVVGSTVTGSDTSVIVTFVGISALDVVYAAVSAAVIVSVSAFPKIFCWLTPARAARAAGVRFFTIAALATIFSCHLVVFFMAAVSVACCAVYTDVGMTSCTFTFLVCVVEVVKRRLDPEHAWV